MNFASDRGHRLKNNSLRIFSKHILFLISLGFTSILSQLIIIREFLNVFEGNELIIGLFLSVWMILTAAGSISASRKKGRKNGFTLNGMLLIILSCIPFIQILLLYFFESWFFPPGAEKGLVAMALFSIVILLPGCFISGLLFTIFSTDFSEYKGENRISDAYSWESVGAILAGVIFSSGIAFLLSTFQILAIVTVLNLIFFLIIIRKSFSWQKILTPGLAVILVIGMLSTENRIQKMHFRGQNVVAWKNTPYGNISVTSTNGQINIYSNSRLQVYNNDYFAEEPVHFVLLQHKNPEKVLIVSGGLQMTREALKYSSMRRVDYVEINPWLLSAEQFLPDAFTDHRVQINIMDARGLIRKKNSFYDALIVNAPDPSSAQLNRFFTREFFIETKRALRDSGVLGLSLSSPGNYMNNESLVLNSLIIHTLRDIYKNITVIPGERIFYIASDQPVTPQIIGRIAGAGISNDYVNPFYLNDELLLQRSNDILDRIDQSAGAYNTDLSPLAYFMQIGHWVKKSDSRYVVYLIIAGIVILITLLILIFHEGSYTKGVFTSAFAGASAEFMLIFLFQVMFGNLYQKLGLLVACYMGGLVIGTMMKLKSNKHGKIYFRYQMVLAILMLILPAFAYTVVRMETLPGITVQIILFMLTFVVALTAGLIFNVSTKLRSGNIGHTAGSLYAVDLAGSAAGALVTSIILLPVAGLLWTCVICGSLVAISGSGFRMMKQ